MKEQLEETGFYSLLKSLVSAYILHFWYGLRKFAEEGFLLKYE